MELLHRVQLLEATQKPNSSASLTSSPAGSLVDRIGKSDQWLTNGSNGPGHPPGHRTPTPLSPAAQSVFNAADGMEPRQYRGSALAAALRAAADQVVPDGPKPSANSDFHLMNWTKSLDQYYQRQQTRAEMLAIAGELDGGTTTPTES
jgi:hypothetical protein